MGANGGWIISLVVAVVAFCAALAALGFRGRITTVGIDLGTTFSVVGINDHGKVIIIEDKLGHKIFPSVVTFREQTGEILAAYDALPYLTEAPQNTIYNAKRFIGRELQDEGVRVYASEHPFIVVESATSVPHRTVSNFSKIGFEISVKTSAITDFLPDDAAKGASGMDEDGKGSTMAGKGRGVKKDSLIKAAVKEVVDGILEVFQEIITKVPILSAVFLENDQKGVVKKNGPISAAAEWSIFALQLSSSVSSSSDSSSSTFSGSAISGGGGGGGGANAVVVGQGSTAAGDATTRVVVSPEQIGTLVLKHLLRLTADFLGHSQVNKAVIAVPAKFDANQRRATGEAYRQAGLKVVRVIEEPTAAAVAYKLHKKSNIHHILVYDFGGGTLDVSLLFVAKGSVQVYATDGDETLGGSDFDLCLYNLIKHKVEGALDTRIYHSIQQQQEQQHQQLIREAEELSASVLSDEPTTTETSAGETISETTSTTSTTEKIAYVLPATPHVTSEQVDLSIPTAHLLVAFDNSCDAASLHAKAEAIKKQLTYNSTVPFSCQTIVRSTPTTVGAGKIVELKSVSFDVTREDFELGCADLFAAGLAPVTRLLGDLEMSIDDVDEVVLVGGTTRVPKVKQQLRDFFGKELNDHIDPDVTVAYGAASILD